MPTTDPNFGLNPSIWDRLLDPETSGTNGRPGYSYEQLVQAVIRDVEALLNARQTPLSAVDRNSALAKSLLGYGLPDLVSFSSSKEDQARIAALLQVTVARYEPRLRNIRARPTTTEAGRSWRLGFVVEAELSIEPHPHVTLETTLDLAGGTHNVRQIGG
jgi:type VI secretion system protein ImpF